MNKKYAAVRIIETLKKYIKLFYNIHIVSHFYCRLAKCQRQKCTLGYSHYPEQAHLLRCKYISSHLYIINNFFLL